MKFRNDRGYTAELIARNGDRVIYRSWDEAGKILQTSGCRSPAGFDRDWRMVPGRS